MNDQQVYNTESFTSIDDIIQFYTQAQESQHSVVPTKESEPKSAKTNPFHK
jgi:hypothetical protein